MTRDHSEHDVSKHLRSLSHNDGDCFENFIALIPPRLISQTLASSEVEFLKTVSKFRKRKRKLLSCVPRRSRATTAQKCTKTRHAGAKLIG